MQARTTEMFQKLVKVQNVLGGDQNNTFSISKIQDAISENGYRREMFHWHFKGISHQNTFLNH
jgi:hypothetical protein